MKRIVKFLFVSLASIFLLTACQSQEDKEKEFKEASASYVNDLYKLLNEYDYNNADTPEKVKKLSKKTLDKKDKLFNEYKKSFDKDALENTEYKELYNTLDNANDIYTHFYKDVIDVSSIKNIENEAYVKHVLDYIYITDQSLSNQKENLKNVNTRDILGKKANNNLDEMFHTDEDENEETLYTFAMLQNEGYEVSDINKLPKFNAIKYNKFKNIEHDNTVSANEYNEMADNTNEMLDKDSAIPHVDDEVNTYLYNIVIDKYNALVDKKYEEAGIE